MSVNDRTQLSNVSRSEIPETAQNSFGNSVGPDCCVCIVANVLCCYCSVMKDTEQYVQHSNKNQSSMSAGCIRIFSLRRERVRTQRQIMLGF